MSLSLLISSDYTYLQQVPQAIPLPKAVPLPQAVLLPQTKAEMQAIFSSDDVEQFAAANKKLVM
jgi:hypothetical protein